MFPDSSELSMQAHEATKKGDAAQLWGLTGVELVEIQRSLKELTE